MRIATYDAVLNRYPVPYESRLIDTKLGATHVLISGLPSLPPLVLIHGAALNALYWVNHITELSRHYQTFSLDLPGHSGKSAVHRLPTSGTGTADWLAQVLDELKLDRVRIVGLSLGGWVTLKFAARYASRVQRAALVAPGGILAVNVPAVVVSIIRARLAGHKGYEQYARRLSGQPLDSETLDLIAGSIQSSSWRGTIAPTKLGDDELARVTMPLLFMVGKTDVFFPPDELMARVKHVLPHAQMAQFESDHLISIAQPKAFMTALLPFLEDANAG